MASPATCGNPYASYVLQALSTICHLVFLCALMLLMPSAYAQVCAAPGVLGLLTEIGANTLLNTYYPGTVDGGSVGKSTLGYSSVAPRGTAFAIAAGDLVLVI